MKSVREATAHGIEACCGHTFSEVTGLENANMPPWTLEIFVAEPQIEMLARCCGNRDRNLGAGFGNSKELRHRAAIIVHVLHDLGANDSIKARVGKGQMKGIPLKHGTHATELFAPRAQILRRVAHRIKIEVKANDGRTAVDRAKAVSALPTTCV